MAKLRVDLGKDWLAATLSLHLSRLRAISEDTAGSAPEEEPCLAKDYWMLHDRATGPTLNH